ncbi:MAG: helicase-related protein, partial [Gammaproteobacteria bacterium]|nr:helicase-related protein [Gammaproteobacteria bacterium]
RYHLGQLLSGITRHFLLMTATPHNGKEDDFRLFMALLDSDRFEGRTRNEAGTTDVSDLMRRMIKEKLLRFDGTPLFPERKAHTVSYRLSEPEAGLYEAVTNYVKEEFNRAEALSNGARGNGTRAGTVGFALTILQRRLASSPAAIYQSLHRRRERLKGRLLELEAQQRKGLDAGDCLSPVVPLSDDDLEDLEDAPGDELEAQEEQILDQATAASSIAELKAELETLKRLEGLAAKVRNSGIDTKWKELSGLLEKIFTPAGIRNGIGEPELPYGAGKIPDPQPSPRQKLVIFTEHRDTLTYLQQRITTFQGRPEAVALIHGGMKRADRNHAQDAFRNDPQVQVLIATDAASEGINLQRAHLMVNYDLPWNPNRIEQRFGRVHRIGQTEVCHLWNLVADDTREGDVYRTLLDKLEQARNALGGQVFDVLGKLHFDGRPLRELMVEAIRYGEQPEVRARLNTALADALDRDRIRDLLEDHALAQDIMDTSQIQRVRAQLERAQLRRLQPYFISSFLREAFQDLGGTLRQRETGRYEITHVPAALKRRDRLQGAGAPLQSRYERITFDKSLVTLPDRPPATLICPGHPLLDALTDLVLERDRGLSRRGAVLVDERDAGTTPCVLFYLEHAIQDASPTRSGERRVISKRMLYVKTDQQGRIVHLYGAPHLDYRPLHDTDPEREKILARDECCWIDHTLEDTLLRYAIEHLVPEHLQEVREIKLSLVTKTEAAVKERLTREIAYWDRRAEDLKFQEQAGKSGARLNSGEARKRADMLQSRLDKRMEQLRLEAQISPLPPVTLGGALVVPQGLLDEITGRTRTSSAHPKDTQAAAARARAIIMETERALGFIPTDRETEKLGYDIESAIPDSGRLRFIEVKGRVAGAPSITVTRNEILYSLNKPDDFILAIVEFFEGGQHKVHYLRRPFHKEPDTGATSVNYNFKELLARAEAPS